MDAAAEPLQPDAHPAKPPFLLLSIILLALTNLPYLWAEIVTPEGRYNVGLVYYYQYEDACSYFAKMRLGAEGSWLYRNRFTTEPHRPVLLFPFYIFLGHAARLSGLGLVAAYHAARVLSAAALLFALARLVRSMKLSAQAQTLAFLFAASAQGFGWTYMLPGERDIPLEYWVTEAFTLQTLMHHPHLILATVALLLAWTDLILYATGESGRAALVRIALVAHALGWVHPRILLLLLLVGGAAGALLAARRQASFGKIVVGLGAAALAGAPPAAGMFFSVRSEPLIARWAETWTPSPQLDLVLYAFGLLWPLALAGAVHAWKSSSPWGLLVVVWFALGSVVPYIPIASQRRLFQGLNIPLGILAGWWIADVLFPWARSRAAPAARALMTAGVFALCLSFFMSPALYVWLGARQVLKQFYPPYAAAGRQRAHAALRAAAKPDDVVLCSPMSGFFLPGEAGVRVVSGHWAETLDSSVKFAEVRAFFSAQASSQQRIEFIRRHNIRFLFQSQWEFDTGPYNPAADPNLWREVWREGPMAIFELAPGVIPPAAGAQAGLPAPEPTPGSARP